MKYLIFDAEMNLQGITESLENTAKHYELFRLTKNEIDEIYFDNYDFEKGIPILLYDNENNINYWDIFEDSRDILHFKEWSIYEVLKVALKSKQMSWSDLEKKVTGEDNRNFKRVYENHPKYIKRLELILKELDLEITSKKIK